MLGASAVRPDTSTAVILNTWLPSEKPAQSAAVNVIAQEIAAPAVVAASISSVDNPIQYLIASLGSTMLWEWKTTNTDNLHLYKALG